MLKAHIKHHNNINEQISNPVYFFSNLRITYLLSTKCRPKPFDLKPKVQYEHFVSCGQFTGFYYSGWIPEQSGLNLCVVVYEQQVPDAS